MVVDSDRSLPRWRAQLLHPLLDVPGRLPHFFHPDEIAVETVAVLSDWNIEIHFGIAFVRLRLAQIPGRARAAHHDAGEAPLPGLLQRHLADVDIALLEDAVARQKPVEVVD